MRAGPDLYPSSPAMSARDAGSPPAARCARVVAKVPPKNAQMRAWRDPQMRARGMPGARCTRSLVCSVLVAHECRRHGRTGITRHSRTRLVLTVYSALSPATNSSCHRHRRIEGFAEPGWVRKTSANLAPATGARTTRFCRPQQCRSSARRLGLTGLATRPARTLRARRCPRPPHPIPTFVTMANAPREG
jgi:hypothetical protein